MLRELSVSKLSEYIARTFEAEELLQYLQVYGEVSNLSFVRGNLYFNLKDENAILPCIMFGASSQNIKEGDQILATGGIRYYSRGGKLNFYATAIMPYGSGLLYQKFVELKNKLDSEGIFDEKHKKPLPKEIKNIGVITSATGAVLHDIQTVSLRRNPALNIFVYPCAVQGVGAENTIIDGLRFFDKQENIDVVIIARGGGSIEDLQPFNTEILAREIVKTTKPVVSAVGHETDYTICDFASSVRAATPSEAAELVSINAFEKFNQIKAKLDKIYYLINNFYDEKFAVLDKNLSKMTNFFDVKITRAQNKLSKKIIELSSINVLNQPENTLKLCQEKILNLNPTSILNRGFARVTILGKVLKDISKVSVGSNIKIEIQNGKIDATVTNKE